MKALPSFPMFDRLARQVRGPGRAGLPRLEPRLIALLFVAVAASGLHAAPGPIWAQPMPWLLVVTAAGLWRCHFWARSMAMAVLSAVLVLALLPGGGEAIAVRTLLVEPWQAVGLSSATGEQAHVGGVMIAAALLLWLTSSRMRRVFAQAALDQARATAASIDTLDRRL